LTTPLPPRILTPAANDHATSTRYTGILAICGRFKAESNDAMTSGKRVYPITQILWANELATTC
jgi:hypothetical protein